MAESQKTVAEFTKLIADLEKQIAELSEKKTKSAQKQVTELNKQLEILKEESGLYEEITAFSELKNELDERAGVLAKKQAESARDLGDAIQTQVEKIPFIGEALSRQLQLSDLGEELQIGVLEALEGQVSTQEKQVGLQRIFNLEVLKNPYTAVAAALLVVVGLLYKAFTYVRDMATELGTSVSQAAKLSFELGKANAMLIGTGKDAQTIAGELIDTFGTLESVNAGNIRDIGRLSAEFGVTSKEIISVQKNLTDLFGMQVDQTEQVVKNIGRLAEAQGVAAGAVISDMASSSEKFAEFAQDGAMGFAQAAIEARKVGANVSSILGAADKLLGFEESITAQFKAQVLTGKQINLENARRLALEGDFLGLTTEIQSIVGEIGDIQTMNVIERRAIADAIGISVQDLQKISRGEQMEQQMTVQDKLDITNKLLAAGNDLSKEQRDAILEGATRQQNQNLFGV